MPKKSKFIRKSPQEKPPEKCPLCERDIDPSYKDYKTLAKFVSDRARVIGRSRSGVCARHQRKLSREIKRARYLALLPYVPSLTD